VRGAISRERLRDAIPFSADPATLWKIEQTRTPVCVCFREFGISAWRFYGVLIVSRVYRTIKSNAQRSDRKTRILIRDYCGSANSLLHTPVLIKEQLSVVLIALIQLTLIDVNYFGK